MRRIALAAVVVSALMSPTAASAYSFGDWASDQGFSPGDVMPEFVYARSRSIDWRAGLGIDSLDGIGDFDWTTTPTTSLELAYNQLTSIDPGDFSGLTNLTSLLLDSNQIASIEPDDFNGLSNLQRLDLSDNRITSIEPGDFSGLPNLTWLNLGRGNFFFGSGSGIGNQIASIEPGDFSGLTNLQYLSLGGQITSIEPGDFNGLSNLTSLNLSYNQLTSIEPDDFSELTNLTSLELSYNPITSIEPGDFSGLTNLTSLELFGSQITSIEPGNFSELTNLQHLGLYGQLTSIEAGGFNGLPNLTSLDMWFNGTTSIESGAFSGLTNLKSLVFGVNEAMTELRLTDADFSSLNHFGLNGGSNITSASLRNTVLTQTSLTTLLEGGLGGSCRFEGFPSGTCTGIGEIPGITEMDLSGIDFVNITDLAPLYLMDDLTDLELINTQNMDAVGLDALLDNLETIEGIATEGILYMTQADFDAFNTAGGGLLAAWHAEPGHHVAFVPEPSTSMLLAGLAAIGLFTSRELCGGKVAT